MAESFLANGSAELAGGDRQQIVVHVDAETLKHDHAGRCELEEGPSLAAETARRLACDASLIRIVENEKGEPLNVGRKTRTIPPAIRRALNSRDGETKLGNLVTLCRFHHRQVHEGRVVVACLDDGAFRFTRPDGKTFESPAPKPTDLATLVASHQMQGIRVTPHTAITRWTGETLDLNHAVGWLLQRRERMKNVSAETPARE
jgi:hypothetical protein